MKMESGRKDKELGGKSEHICSVHDKMIVLYSTVQYSTMMLQCLRVCSFIMPIKLPARCDTIR